MFVTQYRGLLDFSSYAYLQLYQPSVSLLHFDTSDIPVPAGINLPMITFSFNPSNGSTFPLMAASVRTRVVSWKEAAERKESVAREAFVIPSKYWMCYCRFSPPAMVRAFSSWKSKTSIRPPGSRLVSPASSFSPYATSDEPLLQYACH